MLLAGECIRDKAMPEGLSSMHVIITPITLPFIAKVHRQINHLINLDNQSKEKTPSCRENSLLF